MRNWRGIGRSTLRLKGKPCNGGNSENYINARNRKVYTMIELHGVGLLAEGQSASRWRFKFFFVSYASRPAYFFLAFLAETIGFLAGFIFGRGFARCARKKHLRYRVFGKGISFGSLTGSQGWRQSNECLADFNFEFSRKERSTFVSSEKDSFSLVVASQLANNFARWRR